MNNDNVIYFDKARESRRKHRREVGSDYGPPTDDPEGWFEKAAKSFEEESGIKVSKEEMLGICAIISDLRSK